MVDEGTKRGRKLQFAVEATKGTEVNTDKIFRGTANLVDAREWVEAEEDLAILPMTTAMILTKEEAALEIEGPLTAEQFPFILDAGIDEETSPTQDGTGSDYIYQYDLPTDPASPGSPNSLTAEHGDEVGVDVSTYLQVMEWGLNADEAGVVMMSGKLAGQKKETHAGGFTAGAAIPDVDRFRMGDAKVYIDAIGGTVGTTVKSDTLLALSVTGVTGWIPLYTGGSGTELSKFAMRGVPSIEMELTLLHNSNARAEKGYAENKTPRLVRLLLEGVTVATPGTTYSKKSVIIDAAGVWKGLDQLDESDGMAVLKGTFSTRYHATPAYWGTVYVVNELSALP